MRALVFATNPFFGYQVMRCLADEGTEVYALTPRSMHIMRVSRSLKGSFHFAQKDLKNACGNMVKRMDAIAAEYGIDMVIPCDLPTSRFIAETREKFQVLKPFWTPSLEMLERVHHKAHFAELLETLELPHPKTHFATSPRELEALALSYPAVLKPAAGEGGYGVRYVGGPDELRAAYHELGQKEVVVQPYISGRDFDVSFLAHEGKLLAWTAQERDAHDPAKLLFLGSREGVGAVRKIVAHTAYSGVGHVDMRRDEDGTLHVLELNPRFWGSLRYSHWAGVNFPHLGMLAMLGDQDLLPFNEVIGACTNPGLPVRRIAQSLLRGRWVPDDLDASTVNAWRSSLQDPLPVLWDRWLH